MSDPHSPPQSPARFARPNMGSLSLMVLLAASYLGIMSDLDWAWQVRTGQLIAETGSLRPEESFTYTIHGEKVHDFEWLYEVTLYHVWSLLGMGGLKCLKMIVIVSPLILLGWRLRCERVRWHGIALAFVAAIIIVAGAWNLRAMYCTTVGLLLVSWWLHDHCLGRRMLTWWLPVVMLVWSNLHPGVICGQGLLFGAVAWEWLNCWLRFNAPLDWARLKRLTLIGSLGLLATFVSPDPIDRLLYPFRPELAHSVQLNFVEMRPLHLFLWQMPVLTVSSYLLGGLVLIVVLLRARQFRGWELALLGVLTLLANTAIRCLQDWVIIMLALAVPKMRDLLAEWARADRRRRPVRLLLRLDRFCRRLLDSPMFRFQPIWPAAVMALFLIITLIPPLANSLPVQTGPTWPIEAVAFAENHDLRGRGGRPAAFFSSPDYGTYIGWRLKDKALVYADTRGFYFPPQLLEDTLIIPIKGPGWQARLERVLDDYPTDYLLLDIEGERGNLWRDLKPFIDQPLSLDSKCVLLTADQVRRGVKELEQRQLAQR